MGEYASYKGEVIKIGTCENMYYLRADQSNLVTPLPGSLDPQRQKLDIRFRFPFPDEDKNEPGDFDDYNRGYKIPGYSLPGGLTGHGTIQFTAGRAYVVCLPCPEGPEILEGVRIGRNGWDGQPRIVQQVWTVEGSLATVVECGACGCSWRLTRTDDVRELVTALRNEADRVTYTYGPRDGDPLGHYPANTEKRQRELREIADRVEAGYEFEVKQRVAV
jgi:hypothetical protein